MSTKTFISEHRTELKSREGPTFRSVVFGILAPDHYDGAEELTGHTVTIDGREYVCHGVERFGKNIGRPIKPDEPLGLLVKEPKCGPRAE